MCIIVHYLLGGAFLNFNNVIIKEIFHNVFWYYDNPYMKKSIVEENLEGDSSKKIKNKWVKI
jgi:hypothetical protein